MKRIHVANEFYHRLANRDSSQCDGAHNAMEFREKFLADLDNQSAWATSEPYITFNFKGVKKIGPSFANEAFAYFTQYAPPDKIFKRILFEDISTVQMEIIELEVNAGYHSV